MTIVNQPLRPLDSTEMDALRASIVEHGQHVPIVRQASTGELIDGHHRMAVCSELGLEPTVVDLDVDDEKAEALRVELNTARRQMSRDELAALQTRLIRDVYPTTPAPRTGGGAAKASAVAKAVGERAAELTGLPRADVTPTVARVLADKPAAKAARVTVSNPPSPAKTTLPPPERVTPIERGTDLLDATKQQLLDRMCELAGGSPLRLGQALVERETLKLPNPSAIRGWVENTLSVVMGRHVSVGAIRRRS